MIYEINNLKTSSIPEWMRKVKKVCQKQERDNLLENKEEYDHTIELTQETISSSSLILTRPKE